MTSVPFARPGLYEFRLIANHAHLEECGKGAFASLTGVKTMSKKKKPAYGEGQVVQGDILPTIEIDCSDWISNSEEWTGGPVRPVTASEPPARNKRRELPARKSRTRR